MTPSKLRFLGVAALACISGRFDVHSAAQVPSAAGSALLQLAEARKREIAAAVNRLAGGLKRDTIALLDVTDPAKTKIIEVLWQRGKELDVTPRWPVYWPPTRRCYFLGVDGTKRTLYSLDRGKSRRPTKVEVEGNNNRLGGLAFSPDGRYLLMGDNRP